VKQVVAESARAAMEMYQVQFDFQAKMSVVSSSKSSAETLMKNQ
jgi:type III secretion inner rod protein HrpB2